MEPLFDAGTGQLIWTIVAFVVGYVIRWGQDSYKSE